MTSFIDIENTIPKPLIILDWDDTLFPTSWLISNNIDIKINPDDIPENIKNEFSELEKIILNFINHVKNLGKFFIITNSEEGWVISSCKFMSNLLHVLSDVHIISARTMYSDEFPNNPEIWKHKVFSNIINSYILKNNINNSLLDIISIGDSYNDREALFIASEKYKDIIRTKSFLLIHKPCIIKIKNQINLIHKCMNYITSYENNLDLSLSLVPI